MAGNYDDVIGPRVPYDKNGTVVVTVNSSSTVSVVSDAVTAALNDGTTSGTNLYIKYLHLVFIFPQPYDIQGFYGMIAPGTFAANSYSWVQTSVDTTNGLDGTWVQARGAGSTMSSVDRAAMRDMSNVQLLSTANTGVKAMKINYRMGESFNSE